MDALQATSEELWQYVQKCCKLEPYAGPQCFPQLHDERRRLANAHTGKKSVDEAASSGGGVEKDLMKDCWLRCDQCRKWRLVEKEAVASLTGEKYKEATECAKDAGWKAWLDDAKKRYEEFLAEHAKQQVAEGGAAEEARDDLPGDDASKEQNAASRPGEAGACEETGNASGGEGRHSSGSDLSSESEGFIEYLEAEVRREMEEAKRGLGTRHAGFGAQDARELEALQRRESKRKR